MSSSFPLGWEKLDPVEWGLPSQNTSIGPRWWPWRITGTSHRDHSYGG